MNCPGSYCFPGWCLQLQTSLEQFPDYSCGIRSLLHTVNV